MVCGFLIKFYDVRHPLLIQGCSRLTGRGGGRAPHFFGQIKVKSALPPPSFCQKKEPNKGGPLTFQKGDYIPVIQPELIYDTIMASSYDHKYSSRSVLVKMWNETTKWKGPKQDLFRQTCPRNINVKKWINWLNGERPGLAFEVYSCNLPIRFFSIWLVFMSQYQEFCKLETHGHWRLCETPRQEFWNGVTNL